MLSLLKSLISTTSSSKELFYLIKNNKNLTHFIKNEVSFKNFEQGYTIYQTNVGTLPLNFEKISGR